MALVPKKCDTCHVLAIDHTDLPYEALPFPHDLLDEAQCFRSTALNQRFESTQMMMSCCHTWFTLQHRCTALLLVGVCASH